MKCEFCSRNSTRNYLSKNLCELHYLKMNPMRNARLVRWDRINALRGLSSDDIIFLKQFEEYNSNKEISE